MRKKEEYESALGKSKSEFTAEKFAAGDLRSEAKTRTALALFYRELCAARQRAIRIRERPRGNTAAWPWGSSLGKRKKRPPTIA